MGTHDHEVADPSQSAKDYWEAHYAERERIWSGRVNAHFATVVADLPPGRALDLGCGEGGDAVWLAERGWHVTAVDISDTAMGRAGEEARTRGVSERIEFQRHDLSDSFPEGTYDLVSAQFLHSTVRLERPQVLRHAADAVARGGYLVIVDHGGMPPWATKVPHDHPFPCRGGARRPRSPGGRMGPRAGRSHRPDGHRTRRRGGHAAGQRHGSAAKELTRRRLCGLWMQMSEAFAKDPHTRRARAAEYGDQRGRVGRAAAAVGFTRTSRKVRTSQSRVIANGNPR